MSSLPPRAGTRTRISGYRVLWCHYPGSKFLIEDVPAPLKQSSAMQSFFFLFFVLIFYYIEILIDFILEGCMTVGSHGDRMRKERQLIIYIFKGKQFLRVLAGKGQTGTRVQICYHPSPTFSWITCRLPLYRKERGVGLAFKMYPLIIVYA